MEVEVTTNFKSAEDLAGDYAESNREFRDLVDTIKKAQSNIMREAARIADKYLQSMGTADGMRIADHIKCDLYNAAIAIEKGEYKPV